MAAIAGHYRDYHEQVAIGEAFSRFWTNYLNFSGRANRGEFWWAVLAVFLINLILSFVDRAVQGAEVVEPLSTIWGLATLIPSLALSVRRLHDIDRSGWWIVAPTVLCFLAALAVTSAFTMGTPLALVAVPVIAALAFTVVLIVWYCQQGEPRPNRFE